MSVAEKVSLLGVAHFRSWRSDTAYPPGSWSPNLPARGQSVVTALSTQSLLGGRLLGGRVSLLHVSEQHYWNLIGEEEVDFTWQQYSSDVLRPEGAPSRFGQGSTREFLLSHPETFRRYGLYHGRLLRAIASLREEVSSSEYRLLDQLLVGSRYVL